VFVAVSINVEKVLKVRGLLGRAGESLILFLGALIASLFLLGPVSRARWLDQVDFMGEASRESIALHGKQRLSRDTVW
jgi:hypothetical protein